MNWRRMTVRCLVWALIGVPSAFLVRGDTFDMGPAREASYEYAYDLIGWHLSNSMSKWTHRLARAIPGQALSDTERLALVDEYFRLGRVENDLKGRIEAAVSSDRGVDEEANRLQLELERTHGLRRGLRNDVEEALESEISSVVRAEGMGLLGEAIFPPVDVRLEETPKALVMSPRDRIERRDGGLLDPSVSVDIREEIEAALLESENVSALVVDIGGVATYPASVYVGGDLQATLSVMAHEWLHHYLFLRRLGQNMFDSPEMYTLNETVADLGGRELGAAAFERMRERMPTTVPARMGATADSVEVASTGVVGFDFRQEMQKTRRAVDALLVRGEVDMAESYMESRRKTFVDNGYPIRKLNQAYFAFHGAYAESPASVNPIGGQVRRLRELSSGFGEFMSLVSGVSNYDEFLDVLEAVEREATSG